MLLILAAVAINLTIGENGIFTRAGNATEKWKEAEANESQELDKAAEIIDEYLNGNKPKEGTLLAMYYKAIEDKCTNSDGNCQRADHLHIGDYVDFKNPETGVATAEDIRNYNLDPVLNGGYNYNDPYSLTGYTPENYLAEKAAEEPEGTRVGTISDKVTGYWYTVNASAGNGAPYVTLENQRIYNMLFNDAEYGSGGAYWLSSRGVAAGPGRAFFGPGAVYTEVGLGYVLSSGDTFLSNGGEDGHGFGVRPVVSLESNVTNEQVPKRVCKKFCVN